MGLQDYLRVFRDRRWIVVAGLVLGVLLGALAGVLLPARYSSTETLYVAALTPRGDVSAAYDGTQLAQQRAALYASLLAGSQLAGPTADAMTRAGAPTTAADLDGRLTVTTEATAPVLRVAATDTSALGAQARARFAGEAAVGAVTTLERPADPTAGPIIEARVATPASFPDAPSTPGTTVAVIIGALLGLILGAVAALVRHASDRTLRDAELLGPLTGVPVLGVVEHDRRFDRRPLIVHQGPRASRSESFRQIRTALGFLGAKDAPSVLLVAGAVGDEGRSTVLTNLAIVSAHAGRRVIVVGSDLRKPRIEALLGIEGAVGLSGVLTGRVSLPSAIQRWGRDLFDVLPSGHVPPNPTDLLASPRMAATLATLRSRYDLVLLDSPPTLPVADASLLAGLADGVVMVVGRGRPRTSEVERTVATLRAVGTPVLGTVFTMARGAVVPVAHDGIADPPRDPAPARPAPATPAPTLPASTGPVTPPRAGGPAPTPQLGTIPLRVRTRSAADARSGPASSGPAAASEVPSPRPRGADEPSPAPVTGSARGASTGSTNGAGNGAGTGSANGAANGSASDDAPTTQGIS